MRLVALYKVPCLNIFSGNFFAADFLGDPNNGLKEVNDDLKKYSANITGVPYYQINGKHKLSGGQHPEVFLTAFEAAAS